MALDGYEQVVNVDISSVVIRAMQSKHASLLPRLRCTVFVLSLLLLHSTKSHLSSQFSFLIASLALSDLKMDVRDMSPFPPRSFDAVIDKGL